jgi:hypothetical protein
VRSYRIFKLPKAMEQLFVINWCPTALFSQWYLSYPMTDCTRWRPGPGLRREIVSLERTAVFQYRSEISIPRP